MPCNHINKKKKKNLIRRRHARIVQKICCQLVCLIRVVVTAVNGSPRSEEECPPHQKDNTCMPQTPKTINKHMPRGCFFVQASYDEKAKSRIMENPMGNVEHGVPETTSRSPLACQQNLASSAHWRCYHSASTAQRLGHESS